MDGIQLKVEGLTATLAYLDSWKKEARDAIGIGLEKFMKDLTNRVREEIIRADLVESGDMLRSVEGEILGYTESEWEGAVVVGVLYAAVQEKGATIESDGYMVFVNPANGQFVFAEKVTIPATPFLKPVVEAFESKAQEYVYEEFVRRGLLT